ncbi:hypothetical protein OH77DRAFT_989181 [Trametes cingulata]|nr:hypothetical protein OH77DRAFT_989181 [Trametes cingulata]
MKYDRRTAAGLPSTELADAARACKPAAVICPLQLGLVMMNADTTQMTFRRPSDCRAGEKEPEGNALCFLYQDQGTSGTAVLPQDELVIVFSYVGSQIRTRHTELYVPAHQLTHSICHSEGLRNVGPAGLIVRIRRNAGAGGVSGVDIPHRRRACHSETSNYYILVRCI